mgnify:CR=1 FL=1
MRRWFLVSLAILAALGLCFLAVRNTLAIYQFKLEWYWWLLVAAEVLAANALVPVTLEIIYRSPVDKSKPLDLTTELQAQLAAEMIRQHSLKRIDISQDGGMAINGNRVGGV